jgi:hypothetical protein
MNRKGRISLIAAAIAVPVAIIYFAVVPAIQLKDYKKSEPKHNAVNEKLVLVANNFQSNAFTKLDSTSDRDRSDIAAGRQAVKDAQIALDTNSNALTKFKPLPLLSWNKRYKAAIDTNKNEVAYVKKAQMFLKDYTELLNYAYKQTELEDKTVSFQSELDSLHKPQSPGALANTIDSATTKLQAVVDEEKTLTPPEYLQSYQTEEISTSSRLVSTLHELATATRSLDMSKIQSLGAQLPDMLKSIESKGQDLITSLHTSSKVQLEIVELRLLNSKVTKGYAQF